MKLPCRIPGAAVFLLLLFSFLAPAAGAGDIKGAMLARLPEINSLKAAGIVGENNGGYLEFRSGDMARAAVVQAENADRRTVYETIAAQQGTSVDMVGRRRAQQIAANAAPGTWLQNETGAWYRK